MTKASKTRKPIGIGRAIAAASLAFLGGLAVLVAGANLFNIDKQPVWVLGLYGVAGVAAIGASTVVWRGRGRERSGKRSRRCSAT